MLELRPLFLWGVESSDVMVECQVFLYFVHEGVCFASFAMEEGGVLSHGFDVCCCCDWLCHCSSSCSRWSSSSWWSGRESSGSSSLFSYCYVKELVKLVFHEGVL